MRSSTTAPCTRWYRNCHSAESATPGWASITGTGASRPSPTPAACCTTARESTRASATRHIPNTATSGRSNRSCHENGPQAAPQEGSKMIAIVVLGAAPPYVLVEGIQSSRALSTFIRAVMRWYAFGQYDYVIVDLNNFGGWSPRVMDELAAVAAAAADAGHWLAFFSVATCWM